MELSSEITIGDKYRPAMEITDQAKADEYFEVCVNHTLSFGRNSRQEAIDLERANFGYFAGYYGEETRERVERLFKCHHPIFGPISEGAPTPEEALEAGALLAKRLSQ